MERPVNVWVMTTYAEEINGKFPNRRRILHKYLKDSLVIAAKMFSINDGFLISVCNTLEPDETGAMDLDFMIYRRKEDDSDELVCIGDIEYIDEEYYETVEDIQDFLDGESWKN